MGSVVRREAFPLGTLVGERYRIVSTLARGGFGVIYVAEQLATARRVALKLLTSHVHDVSVERLLAEARIASRVNSEHIVQVYDAGIDPESSLVFVAMELLSGKNLAEVVHTYGPRSAAETAEYLRQVALGLDKVHGVVGGDGRPAPIVHRDLKPANLFLTRREDGTAWLKILDFGAAKMLSEDAHTSGVVRGTPEYMAYEQASGGEVTRATDIWAFGLIAFTLLTGRSYWRGAQTESGRAQTFGEILTLPLAPASERARELGATAELGAAFDDWFFRCVNREPSARHGSAGEAARDLMRALGVTARSVQVPWLDQPPPNGEDAPSPKVSSLITKDLAGVATRPRKTGSPPAAATAGVVALLVLGVGAALLLWPRARPTETTGARASDTGSSAQLPAPALEPAPPPAMPRAVASAADASSPRRSASPPASAAPGEASRSASVASHRPGALSPPSASATSSATPRLAPHDDPYDVR
jgi:serine/threonine-protein kinase